MSTSVFVARKFQRNFEQNYKQIQTESRTNQKVLSYISLDATQARFRRISKTGVLLKGLMRTLVGSWGGARGEISN